MTLSDVLLDIGSSCGHFLSIASMYTTVLGIEIDPTTFAGSVLSALKVMKAVEYESRIVPLFGDAVQDFENYLGADCLPLPSTEMCEGKPIPNYMSQLQSTRRGSI